MISDFSYFFFCRNHILPICLPTTSIELIGRKGVIAGWGKTQANMGHTGTNILQSAAVPIISKLSLFIYFDKRIIDMVNKINNY